MTDTKQILKHVVGYTLPLWVTLLFLHFYSHWKITPGEMLKVTGLVGITLFGIIFIIGPLPRFWEDLSPWKVFRPYWAKWAVLIIFIHMFLAYTAKYNVDLMYMFSRANPNLLAISLGLTAWLYFVFMVIISEQAIRQKIGVWWKRLHTVGYAAFALALFHFLLIETNDGIFYIRRAPGRLAFAFAVTVLVTRAYVWIWAKMTKPATLPPSTPPISDATQTTPAPNPKRTVPPADPS